LGAVTDLELGEHVRRVILDGLDRDPELARDLGVAASLRDQGQHLGLAVRET
jgi:hypothetical protein